MIHRLAHMTNATKAYVIAVCNAVLGVALVFGAPLSDEQSGAIMLLINVVMGVGVASTYQMSHKRKES